MNVSLTPELEKVVLEKAACGLYTSASEVIREALWTMVANDRIQQESCPLCVRILHMGFVIWRAATSRSWMVYLQSTPPSDQ